MSIFTLVRNTSTKSKLDVTPTSILIIFAPWFLLVLFWGAPEISASPVPHLDVANRGHTALGLNLNPFSLDKSSATVSQGRIKDSFSGSGSGAGTETGRVGQDQGHGTQLPKNPHPNRKRHRSPYIPVPVPVPAPVLDYKGETMINRMRRDTDLDESESPVGVNYFYKKTATKATTPATTTTITPAPTTTTTTTTPKTTTTTPVPAVPDTTIADFKDYSNKESICYQLCKGGMGGVACDCDLVPIG